MKMKFKHSVPGYCPASVKKLINRIEVDHQNKINKLKTQLADEVRQLELLKADVQQIKKEIATYQSLENEVMQVLIKAHLAATEKVYAALQDTSKSEKNAADKVQTKKNELDGLITTMEKIRKEVKAVASQYQSALEKVKEE